MIELDPEVKGNPHVSGLTQVQPHEAWPSGGSVILATLKSPIGEVAKRAGLTVEKIGEDDLDEIFGAAVLLEPDSEAWIWTYPNASDPFTAVTIDMEADITRNQDSLQRALNLQDEDYEWKQDPKLHDHLLFDARERLVTALSLDARLKETFGTHAVEGWMNEPSLYLNGRTPADAVREGRFDEVHNTLEAADVGVFL